MKLIICTKFHVNRMKCVESRKGVRFYPPLSVRVTIFFFFEDSWVNTENVGVMFCDYGFALAITNRLKE